MAASNGYDETYDITILKTRDVLVINLFKFYLNKF